MIGQVDFKRKLRQIVVVVADLYIFADFVGKFAEELSIADQLFFATYTFVLWNDSLTSIFSHSSLGFLVILFTQPFRHSCKILILSFSDLCSVLQNGCPIFSHWSASLSHILLEILWVQWGPPSRHLGSRYSLLHSQFVRSFCEVPSKIIRFLSHLLIPQFKYIWKRILLVSYLYIRTNTWVFLALL